MFRHLSHILLLLLLACAPAFALDGDLSGEAQLNYGSFTAEEDGEEVIDAQSFSQQYSLLYNLDGLIKEGRGGSYAFALGYELNLLNADVVNRGRDLDENLDFTTGKVLFRGEMKFEPGGLPFRFHAYSRDMSRSVFVEDTLLPAGSEQIGERGETVLSPRIIDDINNGRTITSGATLLLGIRNGSYLGRYRDILSAYPRLLVDYWQIDRRDVETTTPQHYRRRNLAFVSLNKKDNWFHYRYRDYTDFIDHANDQEQQQVLLGTIDHKMVRKWINLTNWVQVSADGGFTSETQAGAGQLDEDHFDLNLFARAQRPGWEASTYGTYQRTRYSDDALEKDLEVPVFADGEISRDTAWRAQLIKTHETEDFSARTGRRERESLLYGLARVETLRTRPVILAPELEAETSSDTYGDGDALRAGLEVFSNSAYRPTLSWFTKVQAGVFQGEGDAGGDVSYWETVLRGRTRYLVTDALEAGAEQLLLYGSGDLLQGVTERLTPLGSLGLAGSETGDFEDRSGTTVHSTSTVYVEHDLRRRLRNRLELTYDWLSSAGEAQSQVIGRHRLDWDSPRWHASSRTEYILGDAVESLDSAQTNVLEDNATLTSGGESSDARLVHSSRLDYAFSRFFETGARVDYDWNSLEGGGSESQLRAEQNATYAFYKVNGLIRRLADINEELGYEQFEGNDGVSRSAYSLLVGLNYYPRSWLHLGASSRYRYYNPEDQGEFAYFLVAALNFPKLQVRLDYAYGDRSQGSDPGEDGEIFAEREEHRFNVSVRKVF